MTLLVVSVSHLGAADLAAITALALVPQPGGTDRIAIGMYVAAAMLVTGGIAALVKARRRVAV